MYHFDFQLNSSICITKEPRRFFNGVGNVYRGSSGGLRVSILLAKIPWELNIYTANLGMAFRRM